MTDASRAASAVDTVVELLETKGFSAVQPDELRRRIEDHLVERPESDRRAQFTGLSSRIAAGIEKYFYKSNDAALEHLVPIVNLGTSNLDVVVRRPGLAQQIYDAGIIVVRAYRDSGREKDARRMARALVETFPGENIDADSTPPQIRKLLRSERNKLASEGSRLVLEPVDGPGCNALINGVQVERRPLVVRPGKRYVVALECGTELSPVWRLKARKDRQLRVPLPRRSPMEFRLDDSGYQHRRRAEDYLRSVGFWAELDRVVGVASSGGEAGSDLLLAHVLESGDARWSDRAGAREVEEMLTRVMPDYRADETESSGGNETASVDRQPGGGTASFDVLSWSLVGGGVAAAGASTWGLIAAGRRARELQCSESSTQDPAPGECEGVRSVTFNSGEFQRARRNVRTVRIVSAAGLAVGAGAIGWGTWRLVSPDDSVAARSPAVRFAFEPGGAMMELRWDR